MVLTTSAAKYNRKHPRKRKGKRGRKKGWNKQKIEEQKQQTANENAEKDQPNQAQPEEASGEDIPLSSLVVGKSDKNHTIMPQATDTFSSLKSAGDRPRENKQCSKNYAELSDDLSSVSYQAGNSVSNDIPSVSPLKSPMKSASLASSIDTINIAHAQEMLNNLNSPSKFSPVKSLPQTLIENNTSISGNTPTQSCKISPLKSSDNVGLSISPNKSLGSDAVSSLDIGNNEHIEIPIILIKPNFESRSRQYKCVVCGNIVDKISQYEDHWITHFRENDLSTTEVSQPQNQIASTVYETVVSSLGAGKSANNGSFTILSKEIVDVGSNGLPGPSSVDVSVSELTGSIGLSQNNLQSEIVIEEGNRDDTSISTKGSALAGMSFDKIGHKRHGDSVENGLTLLKKKSRTDDENKTIDVSKLASMLNIEDVISEEVVSSQEYNTDSPLSLQEEVVSDDVESQEENEDALNGVNKSESESELESDEDEQIAHMNQLITLANDLESRLKEERGSGVTELSAAGQNPVKQQRNSMPLSYRIENETNAEDSGNVFVCNHCQKTFKNFSSLKRHHDCIHVDINSSGYECDICGNKFLKQLHLHNHKLRMHNKSNGVNFFQCDQCDKVFQHVSNLRNHKRRHTDQRPHKCVICRAAFKTKPTLKSHMIAVHQKMVTMKHKCPHCWWASNDELNYKQHVANHEGNKMPYDCDVCGKVFGTKSNYRLHMRLHDDEYAITCEYCGKDFKQSGNYKRHVIAVHKIPNPKKPFKCDRCLRSFFSKVGLDRHYTWHTQDVNLACKDCDQFFTNKNALEMHMRIDHRGISFTCHECGRVFAYEGKYLEHIQKHKKASVTYECANCDRKFKFQSALEFHNSRNECPKRKCKRCRIYIHNRYSEVHKRECHLNITSTVDKFCYVCGLHMKTVRDVFHHCLEHAGFGPEADKDGQENQSNEEAFSATRCQICGQKFHVLSQLVDHIVNHEISEENPVTCDVCLGMFVVPEVYISHLGNCFEVTNAAENENSGYFYADDMGPATMVAMKDIDKAGNNDNSENSLGNSKDESEAVIIPEKNNKEEIDGEIICVLCFKISAKVHGIKHHLLTACPSLIVSKCWKCHSCFDSNLELREHWLTTMAKCSPSEINEPLHLSKCEQCDRKFKDDQSRDTHMQEFHTVGLFDCDECSEEFSFGYLLKLHKREAHLKKAGKYCCLACDDSFTKYSTLEAHLKIHQQAVEESRESSTEKPPTYKKASDELVCLHCDRVFVTDEHLKNHQAVAHGIGESNIVCNICDRQFATNTNLKVHQRTHTQEKPYQCSKCPRTFSQSSNMRRHLLTHGKEPKETK